MRRLLAGFLVLVAAAAAVVFAVGVPIASGSDPSYKVELDNSFGLVNGEQFKVAGVPAGTISNIDLCYTDPAAHCQSPMHALVTVQITQGGYGSFHQDAFCESRPESLIGEYFLNCDPGSGGPVLAPGSTIPITHTQSTIAADLLANIMRVPYRERLTLLINELGAGVAGNGQNLQAALDRAVPALTQTDNLLNLLANDSHTLQDLSHTSNALVTALANKSGDVQRFIVQANNIASETSDQNTALKGTFQNLPGFLEQLRPALQKLGAATQANTPALSNLNSSASNVDRLISDLPPFANSARPALRSLGRASVTGKAAVTAANPTVRILNQFAKPTPELAQNLSIVLKDIDNRSRAAEPDPRSPGGQGYTGLEALLQYVFNQALAIDYFSPFGHVLGLDLNVNTECTPYASPATIAANIKLNGESNYKQCYTWLGPNQPGVNETDPTDPSACVPDPGGEPSYAPAGAHPSTGSPCKLNALIPLAKKASTPSQPHASKAKASAGATTSTGGGSSGSSSAAASAGGFGQTIGQTIGKLVGELTGSSTKKSGSSAPSSAAPSSSSGSSTTSSGSKPGGNAIQNLLNYLLSP